MGYCAGGSGLARGLPGAIHLQETTSRMAEEKKVWQAVNEGSGNFKISKPKRNRAKLRANRVKNVRRAR